MTAVLCEKYGFFNGIMGIEQGNWSNYWRGLIPDGVLTGFGNEMVVIEGEGHSVRVGTGQAFADNHRVWITAEKTITLEALDDTPRYDLIVLRVVYGNNKESKVYVDALKGTPSSTNDISGASVPVPTQVTGETYEIPLAVVVVDAVNITADKITDARTPFRFPSDAVAAFSTEGTAAVCICENDNEYRYNSACDSLAIYLPQNPQTCFMASVCFTASASFTGVTLLEYRTPGSLTSTEITPRIAGDALTLTGKRYNLIIWHDGTSWWVASKAVA